MVLKMKASEFDKDGLYSDKRGRKNHCLIGDYLEIPFFLDLPLGLARPTMSNDVEEILLKMFVRSDFCIRFFESSTSSLLQISEQLKQRITFGESKMESKWNQFYIYRLGINVWGNYI